MAWSGSPSSGLGCPTWPECVPGHFTPVPHQAQGWHKDIEFGNRLLTYVIVAAAVAAFVAVRRWAPRRSLKVAAALVLAGVPLQAVIGGISVLTKLNPVTVSLHFLASAAMVGASAYLYAARDEADTEPRRLVPDLLRRVAIITTAWAGSSSSSARSSPGRAPTRARRTPRPATASTRARCPGCTPTR